MGEVQVEVRMKSNIQPGPDGKPWAVVRIEVGLTATEFLWPRATIRELIPLVGPFFKGLEAELIRAESGLVLPTNNHGIKPRPIKDNPQA